MNIDTKHLSKALSFKSSKEKIMHGHNLFVTGLWGWFSTIKSITVSQESNEKANFSPQVSYPKTLLLHF